MSINVNEAAQYYAQGTAANVNKWVSRTSSAASNWEAKAKSPEAEQNYAAGVQFAVQNQLRLKGLQNVGASEWSGAVQGSGSVYQTKTSMSVNKWANRFSPYASVIDQVKTTLPARVPGNAAQNVINRVVPIAEALQRAKLQGIASSRPVPMSAPAPTGGAPYTGAFRRI